MKVNISAPNLVIICLDSEKDQGRLYHKYTKEAVPFLQYTELVLEMERLFDELGHPQAAVQTRRFDGKKEAPVGFSARQPDPVWRTDEMLAMRGKTATFVVHVRLRQRATWQGDCYWMEGQKNASFVSELELLKLVEAAVHQP